MHEYSWKGSRNASLHTDEFTNYFQKTFKYQTFQVWAITLCSCNLINLKLLSVLKSFYIPKLISAMEGKLLELSSKLLSSQCLKQTNAF